MARRSSLRFEQYTPGEKGKDDILAGIAALLGLFWPISRTEFGITSRPSNFLNIWS
jgi:hypothetical protein